MEELMPLGGEVIQVCSKSAKLWGSNASGGEMAIGW